MTRGYAVDIVDGVEVPPLVVTNDGHLPPRHQGSIHIDGALVELSGDHQGSLWIHGGAVLRLTGTHQGSLHVDPGCQVVVTGKQQGSVHVDAGGELLVEVGGTHQGSVHNEGRYEVHGTRCGSLHGRGQYVEGPGARVVQPKTRNGITYYEW